MNPYYHRARFLKSSASLAQSPPDDGVEVAFAGRSNAGKSSAINLLCNRKHLARTSRTPGRTQLINFFALDERRRIVDLPGYGYARVAEEVKAGWQRNLSQYLEKRRSLRGIVLVVDIRQALKAFDRQMLEWSAHSGINVHLLLTKADKLGKGAALDALRRVKQEIAGHGRTLSVQLFSAQSRQGIDEAHEQLDIWFALGAEEQKKILVSKGKRILRISVTGRGSRSGAARGKATRRQIDAYLI